MRKILLILSIAFFVSGFTFMMKPAGFVFEHKQKLSEYNFFIGKLADLKPTAGVVPYDLNTPLFSNYAEKLRFVKLPRGTKADYDADGSINFPTGTVVIKNFYYPNDFLQSEKGRRIMETRLLVNEENGWVAYPYVWNDEQTDAVYDVAGDIKDVSYTDARGKKVSIHYIIPNKNQCKGCHVKNDKIVLIGPTVAQLNGDYKYAGGIKNQLQYWYEEGILAKMPDKMNLASFPKWDDEKQPLEKRARAYLDVNCGSCHNPLGPANSSGLFLNYSQTSSVELGIMKSPVAAGRGAGKNLFDIVPGKPHKSILTFRMQVNDPGVAMPELGREQVHKEGVELVSKWIKEMKDEN